MVLFDLLLSPYAVQLYPKIDFFLQWPILIVIAFFFVDRWRILLRKRAIYCMQKIMFLGCITDSITVLSYFFAGSLLKEIPLYIGFILTAVMLISLYWCKKRDGSWNFTTAVILGIVQSIALVPGISRFASTYCCARWLGICSRKSFELSFLLEWPLCFAAALQGTYILKQHAFLTNYCNRLYC